MLAIVLSVIVLAAMRAKETSRSESALLAGVLAATTWVFVLPMWGSVLIDEQGVILRSPPLRRSARWTELERIEISRTGRELVLHTDISRIDIHPHLLIACSFKTVVLGLLVGSRRWAPSVPWVGLEDVNSLKCSCGCDLRQISEMQCSCCGRVFAE